MALVLNPDADMLKPFVVRFLLTSALAAATLCARAVEVDVVKCAPGVDPETISVLARELSNVEPYALTPFGGETLPYANPADAAAVLADKKNSPEGGWLIGLLQVNVKTVEKAGLRPEDALEPCTNLRLAAQELKACFKTRAVEQTDDKLRPLLACFFAIRMPEKDMEARIQSVIDRVRPTVPSLSSLMQPKPEAPLVFKVEKPEQSLIF